MVAIVIFIHSKAWGALQRSPRGSLHPAPVWEPLPYPKISPCPTAASSWSCARDIACEPLCGSMKTYRVCEGGQYSASAALLNLSPPCLLPSPFRSLPSHLIPFPSILLLAQSSFRWQFFPFHWHADPTAFGQVQVMLSSIVPTTYDTQEVWNAAETQIPAEKWPNGFVSILVSFFNTLDTVLLFDTPCHWGYFKQDKYIHWLLHMHGSNQL